MIVRSRAPLRLGLAGGGTDVSPYCDAYGGAVLNATIDLYAYTILEAAEDGRVCFTATDLGLRFEAPAEAAMEIADPLILHRAVYRRIVRDFNGGRPLPCRLNASTPASAAGGRTSMRRPSAG